MSIILVNPEGLPEVDLYRQLSIATGSKLIFMAGQVSVDVDGAIVGVGDLTAQAEQCYLNVATALAAAGASFDDVVKLTVTSSTGPPTRWVSSWRALPGHPQS